MKSSFTLRRLFFSLALGVCAFSTLAHAQNLETGLQQSCQKFSKIKPFAYCIYHQEGSKNADVVYYLHGAGGNELRWLTHWRSVREFWKAQGLDAPTVISISYGPIWLLAEKSSAKASGLFEYTLTHVMPLLEKIAEDVTGLKRGRRLIMGESMGGFNTAQLVMKRPELFDKAAILCPAMHDHHPFVGESVLKKYASENHTTLALAILEIVMERIFFSTPQQWFSAEPFSLGTRLLNPKTPPLYVSNALQDQYGFYAGTKRFAELAHAQGVRLQYEEVDGNHCKFDAPSVGTFLTTTR